MAVVARDANAGMDASTAMVLPNIAGLIAGANLVVGPCYIKAADGLVYNSDGTAANEAAKIDGFCWRAALAGQPITLLAKGARLRWGSGLTPGQDLFIAAVAGGLDSAATTGGTVAVARAINDTDIRITRDA